MIVRRARPTDLAVYLAIQHQEWGESMAATPSQLQSRLDAFPAGVLVGESDGKVVAGASFVRLSRYHLDDHLSWDDLTDGGWGTNHDPSGPILFGVDMTVSRHAPRSASARMFVASLELTVREGTEGLYWGSRMPRYHRYAHTMTAEQYVVARNQRGRLIDPEIELYCRVPGVEIVGVVPDYFKDWESGDYGAVLRWPNPVRRLRSLRPFAPQVVSLLYALDRRRNARRRS